MMNNKLLLALKSFQVFGRDVYNINFIIILMEIISKNVDKVTLDKIIKDINLEKEKRENYLK